MKKWARRLLFLTAVSTTVVLTCTFSNAEEKKPDNSQPDVANAKYGPHERNVVDLWKAKSDKPTPVVVYIHGGGFRAGDKSTLSPGLRAECLKAGISVAAINYRLSQQAPF